MKGVKKFFMETVQDAKRDGDHSVFHTLNMIFVSKNVTVAEHANCTVHFETVKTLSYESKYKL